jgi:hypothetical protein
LLKEPPIYPRSAMIPLIQLPFEARILSMTRRILLVGFVCARIAAGQTANTPSPAPPATPVAAAVARTAAEVPTQAYTFDVISIRSNKTPPTPEAVEQDGPAADGFRSRQTLLLPFMTAYVPQVGGAAFYSLQEQIKGLPDWVMTERYDIDARISDQDRTEWQKPQSQKVMLRAMLQALLADRCKLAVHRVVRRPR